MHATTKVRRTNPINKHVVLMQKYRSILTKVLKHRLILGTVPVVLLLFFIVIDRRKVQELPSAEADDSQCRHLVANEDLSALNGVLFTADEMKFALFGDEEQGSDGEVRRVSRSRYLKLIRSRMTKPNSKAKRNVTRHRSDFSQIGQSLIIDKLLRARRNGFFVECGAGDGEFLSNSLYFEIMRNWTGFLIEVHLPHYRQLLSKNRRALTFNGCISPTNRPQLLTFQVPPRAKLHGGLSGFVPNFTAEFGPMIDKALVHCFPFTDLLDAANVTHIDYLSLDVNGAEPEILRTIDWKRIKIDIMSIEWSNDGNESLASIRQSVLGTGLYREHGLVEYDVVFARLDL